MITKPFGICLLVALLLVQFSYAQDGTVSGTVSDELGEALPGATVVVQGTNRGVSAGMDGSYTLVASEEDVLDFSFIGYLKKSVPVGSQTIINVSLEPEQKVLEEIVVTALGVSRDKKSLGYSTQQVGGDEVGNVKTANYLNSLSGKVSGAQIKRNNNMGGSTNIVIRGSASLTGNNQALFVIDGVPIGNTIINANSQSQAGAGFDYGNPASDINPDDIESINVLKGAAASALYGSRAANGVVLITTKKGKDATSSVGGKQSLGITLGYGLTVGSVDRSTFPKYQNNYGGGYGPYYGPDQNSYIDLIDIDGDGELEEVTPLTEDASYGLAFDPNRLVYQWDAFYPESPNYNKATPWVNAKNGPISFLETPIIHNTSVSLDRKLDKGSIHIGYTNFDQKGLLPNSNLKKNNFSTSLTYDLTEKLTVTAFANHIRTSALGRNSTGYSGNLMTMFRQWWQTNVDLKDLKDAYETTRRNITWNPSAYNDPVPIYWDNPYWDRFENYQNDSRNRFVGIVSLNYKITDWLSVYGRASVDTYDEIREERKAVGSVAGSFGLGTSGSDRSSGRSDVGSGYSQRRISFTESNYHVRLDFNKDLSEKLNLKALVGMNIRRTSIESLMSSTNGGLVVPKLYSLQNTVSSLLYPYERFEKVGVDGIFASASLGYDGFLFLDGTVRRDQSSTLPSSNNTYVYPSFSMSFVFSRFIPLEAISFGKFRANYAVIGNSAEFDWIRNTYSINSAFNGSSVSVKSSQNNPDLKPETTSSIELGLEMSFLDNRVGFDLSWYKNNTIDQIFNLPISASTGFRYKRINAGEIENTGVELTLRGTPVKTGSFAWDVNVNWAKNTNKVVSLYEDASGKEVEVLVLGSFQGGLNIVAQKGQPYGAIHGTDYAYLNGERVVDAGNGQYVKKESEDGTVLTNNVIGNVNPAWTGGINNRVSYKNLSLSFLIDIQSGGSIFSLDQYYGLATGLYAETDFINDLGNPIRNTIAEGGGFINPGVNRDGTVNTKRIRADRFGAQGYRRGLPNKAFVYDASYVKLREVVLAYSLPREILQNTFLNNVTLSFVGSNLWIIHKNLPHADPESGLGAGNRQGYSAGSLPTTRTFEFNVKCQF